MRFNKDFVFGAASASYQIEGGWAEDGKVKNIWDTYSEIPGNIAENENGKIACDSFHKYHEDVACIEKMGLKAYRFSISWGRVLHPETGEINEKGMQYYDRLVDLLLSKHIEPYVTLYHWDLPQYFEDNGGWENRATAEAFAVYARAVARRFAGRVKHYFTLNEPQCSIGLGYQVGRHAPGKQLGAERCLVCAHNILLAHGLAVRELRKYAGEGVQIGIASTGRLAFPQNETPENIEASYQASFASCLGDEPFGFFTHSIFLDPVCLGHYPTDLPEPLQKIAASFPKEDLETIHAKLDYLGVNVYNGIEVDAEGKYVPRYQGFPRTSVEWPVTPEVMHWGLANLYRRYGLPLIISENGQSCNDRIFADGKVHDLDRIDTLSRYMENMLLSMQDGTDIRAYFHWSLTDNFEWGKGYTPRFGLVYMDYVHDNRRILKDSAYWLRSVVRDRTIYHVDEFLKNYDSMIKE